MLSLSSERFGEALRIVQEKLNEKPLYVKKPDCMDENKAAVSPAFDLSPAAEVKEKK